MSVQVTITLHADVVHLLQQGNGLAMRDHWPATTDSIIELVRAALPAPRIEVLS